MLYLGGTSFSGELSTSIGRLGSLIELDISACNFTRLVPSSLGHLSQLSCLDLSHNSFSGQIPSSMANLTQLTSLDLSWNGFIVGTLAWRFSFLLKQNSWSNSKVGVEHKQRNPWVMFGSRKI